MQKELHRRAVAGKERGEVELDVGIARCRRPSLAGSVFPSDEGAVGPRMVPTIGNRSAGRAKSGSALAHCGARCRAEGRGYPRDRKNVGSVGKVLLAGGIVRALDPEKRGDVDTHLGRERLALNVVTALVTGYTVSARAREIEPNSGLTGDGQRAPQSAW